MEETRNSGRGTVAACCTRLVRAGTAADGGVGRGDRGRVAGLGRPVPAGLEERGRQGVLDDRAHRGFHAGEAVRARDRVVETAPAGVRWQHRE